MKDLNLNARSRGLLLKRLADFETELFRVMGGYIPGLPTWEWKREVATFVFRDSRRAQELRQRVRELGVPFDEMHLSRAVPGQRILERLCTAPSAEEFMVGIFQMVKPRLLRWMEDLGKSVEGAFDTPSRFVLEQNAEELRHQLHWASEALAEASSHKVSSPFLDGVREATEEFPRECASLESAVVTPVTEARRIGRLPFAKAMIPQGFVFLEKGIKPLTADADFPTRKRWHGLNFLQELQACESCASLLFEAPDLPWGFYFDCARHMWDEARHADFGQAILRDLNADIPAAGLSNCAYNLRQTLSPLDRYAALTTQEADAFPGKHAGLRDALENQDRVYSMAWSYDIADETQHVRYGHKWIPVIIDKMGDPRSYEQVKQDAIGWRAHVLARVYEVYASTRDAGDPEKILNVG